MHGSCLDSYGRGDALHVEAISTAAEKTEMKLTGQAGDVMKESSQIAWSFIHSASAKYAKGIPFFEKTQVHVHIPEGATPKDGPSAGITMDNCFTLSLKRSASCHRSRHDRRAHFDRQSVANGGVKEKIIAAKRSGAKILIFPKDNRRDYDELPAYVNKGVEMHFVQSFEQAYHVAFPKK